MHKLDSDELACLEEYSDNSEFFQSLLDFHTENGYLTDKQYAKLIEEMQNRA